MDKATVKTLLLAAAILSPNLVARAAGTDDIKQICQLSAEQLRSTSRAANGVLTKSTVEKPVTKHK